MNSHKMQSFQAVYNVKRTINGGGIQRPKLEEWAITVVQSRIHPMIPPYYEEIKLDEGKKVAVISFPQGMSKPCLVRNRG